MTGNHLSTVMRLLLRFDVVREEYRHRVWITIEIIIFWIQNELPLWSGRAQVLQELEGNLNQDSPRRSWRASMFPSWTCCRRDPTTNKPKELVWDLSGRDCFMEADLWALADEGESIHWADIQQVLDAISQPRQRGALQPVSWNNHDQLILHPNVKKPNSGTGTQRMQGQTSDTHIVAAHTHTHTQRVWKAHFGWVFYIAFK